MTSPSLPATGAEALDRRAEAVASQRGASVIFVQADPADAPAVALSESLGTREAADHFDIAVHQAGPGRRQTSN